MLPRPSPLRRSARKPPPSPSTSTPSNGSRPAQSVVQPSSAVPDYSTSMFSGRTPLRRSPRIPAPGRAPADPPLQRGGAHFPLLSGIRRGHLDPPPHPSAPRKHRTVEDEAGGPAAMPQRSEIFEDCAQESEEEEHAPVPCNLRILCYAKPKLVHDALSSLSPIATEVVKELGLEGMLSVQRILLMDRQFSLWLLSRLNPDTMSLRLGNGSVISLDEESVELVLGIRGHGAEVPRETKKFNSYVEPAVARVLRLPDGTRHITAGDLSDVIARDLPENPTEEDKDMLRAAVLLFCCTHLLGPRDRIAVIPKDVLQCAMYPRTLQYYNWAKYTIETLRDSAEKLKDDLAHEHKTLLIGGCLLYLQVYYLDSIDFGSHNVQAHGYPRIAHYSKEKIKELIELDKSRDPNPSSIVYGATQHTRKDSPSNPRGELGKAELAQRVMKEKQKQPRSPPPTNRKKKRPEEELMTNMMAAIDRVGLKNKEWIQEVSSELQRENAANFVALNRSIRLKLEALEMRVASSIEGLRKELAAQISIFNSYVKTGVPPQPQDSAMSDSHKRVRDDTMTGNQSSTNKRHHGSNPGPSIQTSEDANPQLHQGRPRMRTESVVFPAPRRGYKRAAGRFRNSLQGPTTEHPCSSPISPVTPVGRCGPHMPATTPPALLSKGTSKRHCQDTVEVATGVQFATNATSAANNRLTTAKGRTKHMAKRQRIATGLRTARPMSSNTQSFKMQPDFAAKYFSTRCLQQNFFAGLRSDIPSTHLQAPDPTTSEPQHGSTSPTYQSPKSCTKAAGSGCQSTIHDDLDLQSPCMPTPDTIKAIILMDSPEPIQILRPGQVVERAKRSESPYKLGLAWPAIQTHVLDHFYQQLAVCTASELNRYWVISSLPSAISITGKKLVDYMGPQCIQKVAPIDICSALVRMLLSTENKMYSKINAPRWRHFLPPEWAINILKGGGSFSLHDVEHMFTSDWYNYRVDGCRVISVPVIVSGWWACYIWDIDRKELHVIDPVLSGCSYAEQNKHHEDTINLLHQGLFTCMRAFFDQWKVDKSGWDARFYSGLHLPSSRAESGYYSVYYAMMFNGAQVRKKMFKELAHRAKKELLYRLITAPGNKARLPSFMLQTIED